MLYYLIETNFYFNYDDKNVNLFIINDKIRLYIKIKYSETIYIFIISTRVELQIQGEQQSYVNINNINNINT